MKKIIILFTAVSFVASFYVYWTDTSIDAGDHVANILILLSMPLTMILVNSYLVIFPKLARFRAAYVRYEKAFVNVFLALTFILLMVHFGLMLILTGQEVNLLLLVPVSIGVGLITAAATLTGFRGKSSGPSSRRNTPVYATSLPMFLGGTAMVLCAFLPESMVMVASFYVLAITLVLTGYRLFDAIRKKRR